VVVDQPGEGDPNTVRVYQLRGEEAIFYEQQRPPQGSGKTVFSALDQAIADLGPGGVDVVVLGRGEIGHILEPKPARGRRRSPGELRQYVRGRLQEQTEVSTGQLADQMLPDVAIPSPAKALSAQREAEARLALLREFGAYTSEEIGALRSKAANLHALASRWRAQGKVFSVEFRGRQLFPGFQFDPASAAPLPVVAEVLAALPCEEMSEWEVALWWVAANEWLDGNRPVDLLAEDPDALSLAAAHLAEPSGL
jgi:hypothetical protein